MATSRGNECKLPDCRLELSNKRHTHLGYCSKEHAEVHQLTRKLLGTGSLPSTYSKPILSSHHNFLTSSTKKLGPLKAVHSIVRHLKPGKKQISSYSHEQIPIKFYNREDPYYEFTNFYFAPIELDGHRWQTTEHYFQAQKFYGTPYYDAVRRMPTPREAFQVSRKPEASIWVRGDWSRVKDKVMLKVLRAKFSQNDRLKKMLLDTGNRELIEHTYNDSYWGDGGGGGRGLNVLGQLLMRVRGELSSLQKSEDKLPVPKLRRSSSISDFRSTVHSESSLTSGTKPKISSTPTLKRKSLMQVDYPKHLTPYSTQHYTQGMSISYGHSSTGTAARSYSSPSSTKSVTASSQYPHGVSKTNKSSVDYNIITHGK